MSLGLKVRSASLRLPRLRLPWDVAEWKCWAHCGMVRPDYGNRHLASTRLLGPHPGHEPVSATREEGTGELSGQGGSIMAGQET